ncbi:hypothetical protein CAL12_24630 [Bordetella genomosp. 8]|uniref:ParB/Sulfiredoxin domain-containing protein n=1 Tax=Bordetella genomosp. 8 TaxID=1416806 RepID=A0A1W6YSU6_9BORD|nr:hypothetical protein [Bordetella genomosp. 8]ARP83683.1 hypothetical protein CAL12_24630 [Bordetella genomosp. 8]
MVARKKVNSPKVPERGQNLKVPLSRLLLDEYNPRFGGVDEGFRNQQEVLDWIVTNFGVEDVISSLAINGYFEAEPLVVEDNGDETYTVKEGNRRLAACLILASDPRARNQNKRRDNIAKLVKGEAWSPKREIPTISFDRSESKSLTAYLGVRHIVSSQPWDSFAKAAWVSRVVKSDDLTLSEIADLTGDKSQTIAKLLEGYNFVKQLERSALFDPSSSTKRGRGSNVSYPFSWVYTLLQYSGVRTWLQLESYSTDENPIPQGKEPDAALALAYMFGDKKAQIPARVVDSREIGKLAYSLNVPERRELLRQGYSVDQIEDLSRPAVDRLTSLLVEARQHLRTVNSILGERKVLEQEAEELIDIVRDIRKSTSTAIKTLTAVLEDEDADD